MARETYAALQAKIEKEINKLQKKAEVLQTKRRKPVISSIITSMREYDITRRNRRRLWRWREARSWSRPPQDRRRPPANAAKRAVAPVPSSPNRGDLERSRQGPVGSPRKKPPARHARVFSSKNKKTYSFMK